MIQNKPIEIIKIIMNFKLIQSAKAPINVDCIKVCPFDKQLFAFAYYQQSQQFLGGVSLQYYKNKQNKKQPKQQKGSIIKCFNILQCGPVLHICWLNEKIHDQYILIGASRSQRIFIFAVNLGDQPRIILKKEIHIQANVFCLYVDCFMRQNHLFQVIVSINQSEVFQLNISSDFNLIDTKKYSKHQYAVWTCRINPFSQKTQFVCGDQVTSIYWYDNQGKIISKNSKAHEQGICDLTFVSQYKMYSGGFDGFVNEFDMRNFNNPVNTYKLGGTIWRILPDQKDQNLLICNSSEKKFQIIKEGKEIWSSSALHGSLAYSADWTSNLLLTSSFYDQIVRLWQK